MLSAHPISAAVSQGDSQGCVEDPPNAVQCSVEETPVQETIKKDIEIDKGVTDGSNQASAGAEPDASAEGMLSPLTLFTGLAEHSYRQSMVLTHHLRHRRSRSLEKD
jgi:hypothetical protein